MNKYLLKLFKIYAHRADEQVSAKSVQNIRTYRDDEQVSAKVFKIYAHRADEQVSAKSVQNIRT